MTRDLIGKKNNSIWTIKSIKPTTKQRVMCDWRVTLTIIVVKLLSVLCYHLYIWKTVEIAYGIIILYHGSL